MKRQHAILFAAATVAVSATASGPEANGLEDSGWRVSVGVRTAPSVKTRASLDTAAVVDRAGRVAPFARSSSSTTTEKTPRTGTPSGSGLSREEALAAAAQKPDGSYEFDNGYVRPDSATTPGTPWNETWNWHFDSASAYSGGTISGTTAFGSGDGSSTVTTRRETVSTLSETTASGMTDTSDKCATGFDLGVYRELWSADGLGVGIEFGWTIYEDTDVFHIRGRAYEGRATTRSTTETTAESSGSSGTITTTITVDPSFDIGYATMPDGSLGGASYDGMPSQPGWNTPLLVFDPSGMSSTVTETGSGSGGVSTTRKVGGTKTRGRTVDVSSEGELSLQEVRFGAAPFWEVSDGLQLRAGIGAIGSYAELETKTTVFVDGSPAFSSRHEDDDWKFQGYASLSLAVIPVDWLELSIGAEARFPTRRIRFDDGIVSGSTELPKWDAFAAVSLRF